MPRERVDVWVDPSLERTAERLAEGEERSLSALIRSAYATGCIEGRHVSFLSPPKRLRRPGA
jgi:hypothetical protein